MEWASNLISEVYTYLNNRDDTGIDRLNRLYTVAILSAFVTIISTQDYVVGGKIVCWSPKDFTDVQNTYAHDMCWLGHTNYYVSENLTTLYDPSLPRDYPFLIYPWLPIILLAMTVCFAAPYLLIWHGLSTRSGINIKRLMKLDKKDDLTSALHFIFNEKYFIKKNGRIYVIIIYISMKICYIINIFVQLIIINKLLLGNYFHINIKHIFNILSVKYNMWSSAHFPIETMCDFMVRMLGENNNWYTIQCLLPFNLFTKRIFALLTLWFILLLILNLIDLIFIWFYQRLWLSSHRYNYILHLFDLYETHLHDYKNDNPRIISAINDHKLCEEFVYNYLGLDGYLLLKFLHANSSDMDMSYLVINLMDQFVASKFREANLSVRQNDDVVL